MNIQLPEQEHLQLRLPATPQQVNATGDIFGGWIMSQVDIAGSIPAVKYAKSRVATVAVNRFVFLKPVFIADLVNIYAWIDKIGTTSITVTAEVYVERDPSAVETIKVAEAQLVYVSLDSQGKPKVVEAIRE